MSAGSYLFVFAVVAWVAALFSAPWSRFRNTAFQHVFFGFCVAAFFIWQLRAAVVPSVPIHFLCLTTLTLMFGMPLATIAAAILTAAMCATGIDVWQSWPRIFLALGVVPALVTRMTLLASQRLLPPNPFIYIFVCGFFGAAVAIFAAFGINCLLLLGSDQVSFGELQHGYLMILPLMLFPEAFINGLVVTGLVVFKPAWISSFDDEVYLKS